MMYDDLSFLYNMGIEVTYQYKQSPVTQGKKMDTRLNLTEVAWGRR